MENVRWTYLVHKIVFEIITDNVFVFQDSINMMEDVQDVIQTQDNFGTVLPVFTLVESMKNTPSQRNYVFVRKGMGKVQVDAKFVLYLLFFLESSVFFVPSIQFMIQI